MKICILTDIFPSVSETWVKKEVEWLSKRGHEVTVAARELGDPAGWQARFLPVPVAQSFFLLLARGLHGAWFGPLWRPGILWQRWREAGTRRLLQDLSRIARLRHVAFDAIHAHFGSVAAQYSLWANTQKSRFVVTFHGYDLRRGERTKGRVYKSLFASAHKVIAISELSQRRLEEFGCPREKMVLERMGIDLDAFSAPANSDLPGEFRVVTVARLAEEKNLTLAIRCMARLKEVVGDVQVRYRIVGEGPLRDKLEDMARERGIRVELPGAQPPQQVAEELRNAQAFLLTSEKEVAPVSILEAMGSGLPVIATNVGAVAELVVNGKTGFVCRPGDGLGLAEKLAELVRSPHRAREMGLAGRARAEELFDFEKQMKSLESLLGGGGG